MCPGVILNYVDTSLPEYYYYQYAEYYNTPAAAAPERLSSPGRGKAESSRLAAAARACSWSAIWKR